MGSLGSAELLILLAFPVILAMPVLAVRYLGSSLVRGSGADRTIAVPVADALAGTLPMVCAKTGTKAHGLAAERSESLPAYWFLLLLLGPAGILALAVVWGVRGRSGTQVDVPLSSDALEVIRRTARSSSIAAAVAGLLLVVFVVTLAAEDSPKPTGYSAAASAAISAPRERSSYFSTLPLAFNGSASTNWKNRGTL